MLEKYYIYIYIYIVNGKLTHTLQRYRASDWANPLIRCGPTQPMAEHDWQGSGSHRLDPPMAIQSLNISEMLSVRIEP